MELVRNIHRFVSPEFAVGVSVFINSENKYEVIVLELICKKKEWVVKQFCNGAFPLDSLLEYVTTKKQIHLVLDGKGIIHRKMIVKEDQDPLLLLFPSARKEDFITQSVVLNSGEIILSVIRSELAETIINQLYHMGYRILSLSLGPYPVISISEKLEKEKIFIPHWQISKVEKELEFIPSEIDSEDSVYINKKPISSIFLEAYAVAAQQFDPGQNQITAHYELVEKIRNEERYRIKFNSTGKWFLAIVFILLICNFFLLQSLTRSRQILTYEMGKSTFLIHKLDSLRLEFLQKSNFLAQSGMFGKTKYSQFADGLVSNVPLDITLTRLEFNPLVSKPRPEQEIRYNQKTVIVNGKVMNSVTLDKWLNKLKSEKWVADAEVMDYRQEDMQSQALFSLRILIK